MNKKGYDEYKGAVAAPCVSMIRICNVEGYSRLLKVLRLKRRNSSSAFRGFTVGSLKRNARLLRREREIEPLELHMITEETRGAASRSYLT
jgi:hypothetical protein